MSVSHFGSSAVGPQGKMWDRWYATTRRRSWKLPNRFDGVHRTARSTHAWYPLIYIISPTYVNSRSHAEWVPIGKLTATVPFHKCPTRDLSRWRFWPELPWANDGGKGHWDRGHHKSRAWRATAAGTVFAIRWWMRTRMKTDHVILGVQFGFRQLTQYRQERESSAHWRKVWQTCGGAHVLERFTGTCFLFLFLFSSSSSSFFFSFSSFLLSGSCTIKSAPPASESSSKGEIILNCRLNWL